jgi:hypothetical protein
MIYPARAKEAAHTLDAMAVRYYGQWKDMNIFSQQAQQRIEAAIDKVAPKFTAAPAAS